MSDMLCRSRTRQEAWDYCAFGDRHDQAAAKRIARTRERQQWQRHEAAAETDR